MLRPKPRDPFLFIALLAALAVPGCGSGDGNEEGDSTTPVVPGVASPGGSGFEIVRLNDGAMVALHARPAGKVIGSLGPDTEFGSAVVLGVVRRRGAWLGVSLPAGQNGRLSWVRFDPETMRRLFTPYSIAVDLSERALELRRGRRVLARRSVTVGAGGTDTPTGRFAITDALTFSDDANYGCCALALSGRQPSLPPGWLGGDRIAIHGTFGSLGEADSAGCIRTGNETMRLLFRAVPLGAPVFIRD